MKSMTLYKTVFLADDDVDDRDIFMDAVREIDSSIHCLFAPDGEIALKALDSDILEKPELIFLDLNMPKINGKQLLRQLKRIDGVNMIPVIMYSTYFTDADLEEIKGLGAVHCLLKKTRFSELRNSLNEILSKRWDPQ